MIREPTQDAAGAALAGDAVRVIDAQGLDALIVALARRGYDVVGPTRRDAAIVYDTIAGIADLPRGWIDIQEAGHYRLERDGDAYFRFTVGPHSWKRYLHPPRQRLWETRDNGAGVEIVPQAPAEERYAFVGVRACELHAIRIQDRVFVEGRFADERYRVRRENALIIAVNCTRAGGTCFCVSMDSGPRVDSGFDLALTEIGAGDRAEFLVEAGSDQGRALLGSLASRPALAADLALADGAMAATRGQMGRRLDTDGLAERLQTNPDHARWTEVSERCLHCANCTMVCPTCFCTAVEDASDLDGQRSSHEQRWDSCFSAEFTHLHGGAVRESPRSRYRQWLTHKLGTWEAQFGTSGCVGCGRCVTWCPVGIDITEEAAAIGGIQDARGQP